MDDSMSNPIQQEYETLPEETRWTLEKADGYIDLKLYSEAHSELQRVPTSFQTSLPYRLYLLRLLMAEKDWVASQECAIELNKALPNEPSFWIQLAYATRRAVNIQAARDILLEAMIRFPNEAIIPYNLACYSCRDGELDKASSYLDRALHLDPKCKHLAQEDEDLEPLWDSLANG